ncbi:UDP-N-acetylmuramoyl-L-alanine--D-glutamate ligase [Candidatus Nardonella dryophthoridicola]|uniref:UDP-N-acetylmuramoyl-L-alanine--D-glutamate ligase n=1 Tax=Candidatus Nardonella dryophthoridicola TaxID=1971485 RepID=UPI001AD87974|nr:UDP-N-acetylmuramoyl-L-alanine--D-glutamate ligase [Candidatus Nardonella dryophthoridicola]QTJ62926.1 UDP-N-acetylmuramoyl-L-alanine--D-glutamate ligase [Candidatus Nardonella dryophthoridicola]
MFKNSKNITLIGIGLSNLFCLKYLNIINKKFNINIIDKNENPKFLSNTTSIVNEIYKKNIKLYFGNKNTKLINNIIYNSDYVIISPSINKNNYNVNTLKVINDFDIFFSLIKDFKKIILVTGTNGKSTIVYIIYKILINCKFKVFIGGNIGVPILYSLYKKYDYYIIELSSFQIENISFKYKNLISIISNIDFDHLDRHINFEIYKDIKLKIFDSSLYCLFNIKNLKYIKKKIDKKYITFGFKNSFYNIKKIDNNFYLYKNDKLIINCNKLKIIGINNYINILSAIAATDILNVNKKIQIDTIKKIKNLKYRYNVRKINNNIWINDSKSTNLHSTISAINNTKNIFKFNNIHLILGGDRKNINFVKILKYLNKNFIVYCFGKDRFYINNIIKNSYIFYKLEMLFYFLINKIKCNDIILFSPGCSSLDQYLNFMHRGYSFNSLIESYFFNDK